MKFDTEGTYTLTYTATDSCGNSTSENRTVVVASPRTVLYTDGTFIINEQPEDRASNEALHGAATNTYEPMLADGSNYTFSDASIRPWDAQSSSILSVKIGEPISAILTSNWFSNMTNLTSLDLHNLDTSNVISMGGMFYGCTSLITLDLSNFNTSNVQTMSAMFSMCSGLTTLNLSDFSANSLSNTTNMFYGCSELTTIYASHTFDLIYITSRYMFANCTKLVGGAGTVWSSSHTDYEYARIDNPPDAPGYFTLKPSA